MAFGAAAGDYAGTQALAELSGTSGREKIKATIEGFGCTGGKIERADYGYEVDDVKCKDGRSEIKLDPNFKLIVMTRDTRTRRVAARSKRHHCTAVKAPPKRG
jgi:hypothetical protein